MATIEVEHGTYYAYRYKRCRCLVCVSGIEQRRAAKRDEKRDRDRILAYDYHHEHRGYRINSKRRWDAKNRALVAAPRRGHWSATEDRIVMRDDITMREKAAMLQRAYAAVANRRFDLVHATLRACEWCGTEFPLNLQSARVRGRFCSKPCAYASMKADGDERNSRNCEQCGTEFRARARRGRFCSLKCSGAAHRLRQPVPCPDCGRLFTPVITHSTKHGKTLTRFCSMQCAGRAKRQETRALRRKPCMACGEQFVPSDARSRTCSRQCGSRSRRDRKKVAA